MHYFRLYSVFLFINASLCLFGQSEYYRELIFQNITVNDGLAHRTVLSIAQDQQGYIWIGTNNGLNRYEGDRLTTYRWNIADTSGLPGNIVEKLFLCKKGRLWIISSQGQLAWYNYATDQFVSIKTSSVDDRVRDITNDQEGNIWVLCNVNELFRLDPDQNRLIDTAQPILFPSTESKPYVLQLKFDPKNRLWITTAQQGVHLFRLLNGELEYEKPLFEPFKSMTLYGQANQGGWWIAHEGKIFRSTIEDGDVNLDEIFDIRASFPQIQNGIRDIIEDRKGQIWVAVFGSGLIQIRKEDDTYKARHFSGETFHEKGLNNPHTTDLFLDRYNVLWIGTQAGIFSVHVNQKPFYLINKIPGQQESLIHHIVHAIYRDKFLWVGTIKGLTLIDTESKKFHHYPTLTDLKDGRKASIISSIFKDSRGIIWIGTDAQGLFKVLNLDDPTRLSFERIKASDPDGVDLTQTDIRAITEDEYGKIWIGTADRGIFLLSGDSQSYHLEPLSSLRAKRITNLYKDPYENAIWAASWENGLIRINIKNRDDHRLTYFKHEPGNPNSLSINHVNPIQKTAAHTLWVGTIGGGLNKLHFHPDGQVSFRHFSTHDGLADNTIHSILADDAGNLWLGGSGLTRFEPANGEATHFDAHDGLQSNLFIVNAAFRDQKGHLYFGGPYGLNFFDPSLIHQEESPPDLLINGLNIMNNQVEVGQQLNGRILLDKPVNQLDKITIEEKENDITLDFLALHTVSPKGNRLRYRLKGYQETWRDVNRTRATVTYSNLKPGNYQFQVSGCNGDGWWAPDIKTLSITILPHWYKTTWAFFGYAILFIVLLLLFRRTILIQSNLKNNLKFAEIEIQKDHEVAEMKTRFFNNITHELRSPLTLIQGPVEELLNHETLPENTRKDYYYLIRQNTLKLLSLVNRLLDFRKAETNHFSVKASKGDFISFAKEIFLSFQFLALEKDIQYTFHTDSKAISLYFDIEKMEIVLCNLLSNAFKYSKSGESVSLNIRQDGRHCIVSVSDSGQGIPQEEVQNIFNRFYQIVRTESSHIVGTGIGLAMVKEIVELHHGDIEVKTKSGEGSEFIVRLPFGRQHFEDTQIVQSLEDTKRILPYRPSPDQYVQIEKESTLYKARQKMLIVEDNQQIRAFIRSIFQSQFVISEASNGSSGLKLLEKQIPDIIISDIMMEPMDGITFCHKLREHQKYLHLPIILLTARTSSIFKIEGLDSGADAYITKPFDAKVLKAQVNNLLRSRTALRKYYHNQITQAPQDTILPTEEAVFMDKLIQVVEERLGKENLTAEALAEMMAMSHSTLYRRIKTYTGESINSFIRAVRLKKAAMLLTNSSLNISEVAWDVGFSDVNYFGKCFRKQFQMSPSDYIRAHSSRQENA